MQSPHPHVQTPPACPQMSPHLPQTLTAWVGWARMGRNQCTSIKVSMPVLSGVGGLPLGTHPLPLVQAGEWGGRMAEVWVSLLSFECHTQSKVGLWFRLEGFQVVAAPLGVCPCTQVSGADHGWGCRESNRRPCILLAMSSYLYIQSLCF